jgi:histidinol-phosphate aminotransferase
MPPPPRPTGAGFEPYVWAATAADVAARHRISPAHVLRFDANLPAFPARLAIPPRRALATRAEYPEGSYRELREAAAAYADCALDEIVVDAGADGLIGLVARAFLEPRRRAVVEAQTYPLYAIASRVEGAEVEAAPRDLDALAAAARSASVLWLCNPGNPGGELFRAGDVADVARSLPSTLLCIDEAYYEYGGDTVAGHALALDNLVCIRTLSKAFGLAGLRVGYAVTSAPVAAELNARRAPAPISTTSAALAASALKRVEIEPEVRATTAERERVRAALAAAGYDAPPTHTNFVVVRTPQARGLAARLERRGLVVRAYAELLRVTVRSPADDDLLLDALGLTAPPSAARSGTVLGPGIRASLVVDGSGRATSLTGDDARDRRIEERARDEGIDLELIAEASVPDEDVEATVAEARARALADAPTARMPHGRAEREGLGE